MLPPIAVRALLPSDSTRIPSRGVPTEVAASWTPADHRALREICVASAQVNCSSAIGWLLVVLLLPRRTTAPPNPVPGVALVFCSNTTVWFDCVPPAPTL